MLFPAPYEPENVKMVSNWGYMMAVPSVFENPVREVHGVNMGPNWDRQDTGGPHVGSMKFAIWEHMCFLCLGDTYHKSLSTISLKSVNKTCYKAGGRIN